MTRQFTPSLAHELEALQHRVNELKRIQSADNAELFAQIRAFSIEQAKIRAPDMPADRRESQATLDAAFVSTYAGELFLLLKGFHEL